MRGRDIDGCISEYPAFFRTLSHALCGSCQIVVLTNRDPAGRAETEKDLDRWGIRKFSSTSSNSTATPCSTMYLALSVVNTTTCLDLPESVCVCKVREPENFNFETKRWLYSDRTGERTD